MIIYLIMCGTKLLTLKFRKTRILEKLEKFTKTFGLKELKKRF